MSAPRPPPPEPVPVEHAWPRRALRTLQFALARLVSRDGYVRARAAPFDLSFTGPAADVITRHIYRFGAHEPAITRYLLEHVHLSAGDVAFDVGANLGWYSVLLQRLSEPGARIFAFEPDPETYALLCRNLADNRADRVTPVNAALGAAPGTARLHRYKQSNNGRHTLIDDGQRKQTVSVAVDTLQSFWNREALGQCPIRLLKIDVEGFEYFVLKGAGELLGRCENVLLEYSPGGLALAGLRPAALIELLQAAHLSARAFVAGTPVPMSFAQLAETKVQHDLLLAPG